jgi:excinuclease ABC subunit B
MEGARAATRMRGRQRRVAEPLTEYANLSPEKLLKKIKQLEKRMYRHARDLEFEEAARLRDEIQAIRQHGLGFPESKAS